MDAVDTGTKKPDKKFIFLSIGFETTAPAEAVCVLEAKKKNVKKFLSFTWQQTNGTRRESVT